MIPQEIEKCIVKYLTNQATLNELNKLSLWLEDSVNEKLFTNYVKANYAINYAMKEYNTNKTKKHLLDIIQKEKNSYRLFKIKRNFLKYAAILVVCLTAGYGYLQGYFSGKEKLKIPDENITLQINENEEKFVIKLNELKKTFTFKGHVLGTQVGNKLKLSFNDKEEKEELIYNTLTVPYGKRFKIELSDGTLVDLNAGSSLKYPINFINGKNRHVYLEGEAFFNVAKDKKHPFIVNANEIDVVVLGTKFNVSSYPEDNTINTVLIEGSVSTYQTGKKYNINTSTILKPGYKAAWHKKEDKTTVEETDIETHIAWINGRLVLYEVSFNDILKKLERQYNVTFINNNKALEDRYFTAKFDVENIYQVVESLSYSGNFTYKLDKDKIIINP